MLVDAKYKEKNYSLYIKRSRHDKIVDELSS